MRVFKTRAHTLTPCHFPASRRSASCKGRAPWIIDVLGTGFFFDWRRVTFCNQDVSFEFLLARMLFSCWISAAWWFSYVRSDEWVSLWLKVAQSRVFSKTLTLISPPLLHHREQRVHHRSVVPESGTSGHLMYCQLFAQSPSCSNFRACSRSAVMERSYHS